MKKKTTSLEPSSFRDPSGFVYYKDNSVFRHINEIYKNDLDHLISSGLFDELIKQGYLLKHTRLSKKDTPKDAIAVFKTKKLPFISYPYEWSFSQLKDASLLTLKIQKIAFEHGMILKDASNYNVQFLDGKPVFIDLLSFEVYKKGSPWVAYKQFCQHFLGPLLLMSKVDLQLIKLLRTNIDGIPLPLVSKLLPKTTYLSFAVSSHIHLHAKNQTTYADSSQNISTKFTLNKYALLGIFDSLESLIKKTQLSKQDTEWGEYYTFTNYSDTSFLKKGKLVEKFIKTIKPKSVWDIGANNGEFSRMASSQGIFTVSSDYDPLAVEKNYRRVKSESDKNILPLVIDLANPSPNIGWANSERNSLINRGPADMVLALALIHHLAISNNLPLSHIADFCSKIGKHLVIEFVPKEDSQVKILLKTREDIFNQYTQKDFEKEFSKKFNIIKKEKISGTKRTLYLLKTL
jgi:hypothetical protein